MKKAAGTQTEPAALVATEEKTAKKTAKPARKGQRRAAVAAPKGKSAKKASRPSKDAPAQSKVQTNRVGGKTAQILDLLERDGGATLADLMAATQWQPHSVRGFLSTLRKRRNVVATKREDGVRAYSIRS